MELKLGYKQTEVGVIPDEWEVKSLDSLGRRGRPAIKAGPFGSSLTKDTYVAQGYKVYGQEQVIRGDYLFGDYFISKARYDELKSCAVMPGDVLLSLVGTAGRILVVPDDAPEGIINPRLIRFSFDPARVCSRFFKALFDTDAYQGFLSRYSQGGTMGVLNAGLLRPVCIPLPALPEQHAIAGALGDVDTLLGALTRLIAKKRDLKQAAMQQLLTGQTRLPGFSEEWEVKRLGEVAKMRSGGTPPSSVPAYYDGDIPWVSISDMTNGGKAIVATERNLTRLGLESSAATLYPAGTVLYAMYASIGECSIASVPVSSSQAILGIRPGDEVSTEFLYYWLCSLKTVTKKLGQQGTQSNLNAGMVRALAIGVSKLPEQSAIAAVLSDMDAELAALEQRLAKTRALKQGMMQELLTGRTRLV
jgi:type I restriction enzyme S subunit